MAKFRKKPVVIEAIQFTGQTYAHAPDWLQAALDNGTVWFRWIGSQDAMNERRVMQIRTLEGVMQAEPSDWIIRGVKGELYPCKPDIFTATYEAVEEPTNG